MDENRKVQDIGAKSAGLDQPKREVQVSRELNQLHEAVQRVQNLTGDLVDRLHPILNPNSPKADEGEKLSPVAVPLAESIKQARIQLDALADELISVTSRLEI